MSRRLLLALPAAALLGSIPLADCSQFEIHCLTVENCLQGQVCVAGLCRDADGGATSCADGGSTCGTGGASGTTGTSGTGGSGTGGSGTGGSGTDGGTCTPACSGTTPHCVGVACVQCTQATMMADCKGQKCCPNNTCALLGACL